MAVDLTQFHAVFFEEAAEHLADMERRLVALDPGNPERDDVDGIFRAAHSIKGGANMFGFAEIAQVTHELETLLDAARRGSLQVSSAIVDAALGARDFLQQALSAARAGRAADASQAEALSAALRSLAAQRVSGAPDQPGGTLPSTPAPAPGASSLELSWPAGRERSAQEIARQIEQVAELAGTTPSALAECAQQLQEDGSARLTLPAGADLTQVREGLAFVLPP
jgi:two-component system chemotaxis sensor kinase CheA